jgi:hypothetical protein
MEASLPQPAPASIDNPADAKFNANVTEYAGQLPFPVCESFGAGDDFSGLHEWRG